MEKEQPNDGWKHFTVGINKNYGGVVKYVMGGAFILGFAVIANKLLSTNRLEEEFLKKEVVTLEGNVVDERYVPPIMSDHNRKTSSEYYFSIDDTVGRRLGIQVIDSPEPPLQIEYVDARLEKGTTVKVKARQVGEFEYKAFANEVYLK